ncbi:MAG TPA: SIS domain-containing protein [Alphaproteobacteria bacterium]|nr:SIS domain-containing protein [Alphaproteobacteria bacterium]
MSTTEQIIFDQFPYWRRAPRPSPLAESELTVFVGCGTSYNLALSLAASANAAGRPAIAVPGGEWGSRHRNYWPRWERTHVVALSRSGETTETVAAARLSRAAGAYVTGITVEPQSALVGVCDAVIAADTDPREGIVMTVSASLMLMLGLQALGCKVEPSVPEAAHRLLLGVDKRLGEFVDGRSRFVYLGGGPLYGIGLEGALKLTEMSQITTQAFHPLEYRHGPISLVDDETAAVLLYGREQQESEIKLAAELQDKGAYVLGLGGPGDIGFEVDADADMIGLVCLPALQLLGERAAQARNIDTEAPRHLTKVVTLA